MKANIYYKKDKKCRPVKVISTQNDFGQYVKSYQYITAAPIWCYTRQLSQDQTFSAHAYGDDETRLFVLNYRNDLALYNYIEYNSKFYTVTRIDTADDYKTDLYVYVKDTALGDTPSNISPAS